VLEQAIQNRVDGVVATRLVVRNLQLSQYLGLAEHHRVKPGGNTKQVACDFLIAVLVNIGFEAIVGNAVMSGQPVGNDFPAIR